ncbi:hypothetical protein [Mycobacterium celatum]|uniref:YCII-related domain-containing protein n=1 Tax=Mycobacterium celatum TaxID=28045 RepID=A0A1X1RLE8_MYCCE|nr:hypothetical protein [Mycobacterium celatum]ORV08668.1 hypothetical protein AWB95_18680 [Mycobacterium celatum]PIB78425.1 hypothetical protein CQY23_13760 [Mycobacterium celatum]
MKTFTDDQMNELLSTARSFSLVVLKPGPNCGDNRAPALMWEHGRRNLGLRDAGMMAAAFTVLDGSEIWAVRVFTATVEDTTAIMNDDPGVVAGVFTFEVHPCRGFAGDSLP